MALVGGGLQSALIALATLAKRPHTRIAIVERETRLGGNHLWSFHESDVPAEMHNLIAPLVVQRWEGWEVKFPGLARRFDHAYASITSDRVHQVVRHFVDIVTGTAIDIAEHDVLLGDGRTITADVVIDARGPDPNGYARAGYQKFVGLELDIEPRERPMLMDATVDQTDGFRFLYVLPFADRVMVEDTYFSDTPHLDQAAIEQGILERFPGRVLRREHGVLPLPLEMSFAPTVPLVAGYRGGFFHPTTGYSFPVALRLAMHVAASFPNVFDARFRTLCDRHARQLRFALLLNRLLFVATPPQHRRDVMERFHRLPEPTIQRFYALDTTATDRARVICGRPPTGVSLRAALAQVVSS
jgi:lycopene beta-cyclase